jgi:2-hydroxychromene-2-carboxylate isomerase
MATVKISQLPVLSQLSANNANTVFVVVDKTTNTTSQFSTTVLAQGLYANNILNVGTANTGLLLPNSVAQFISNTAIFSQVNFQNLNPKGSGDIVITADNGDNSNNYLDLGVQGSNMDADPLFDLPNNDGYLYMHGKGNQKYGNLWIGTAIANTDLVFFTGAHKQANEVARIEDGVGLSLKMPIKFADNTIQNTAAVTAAHSQIIFNQANSAYNFAINVNTYAAAIYAQSNTQSNSITVMQGVNTTQNTNITTANNQAWAAFDAANTNSGNIAILQAVNTTQNTNITTANNHAWAAFTKANNALANTTGIFGGTLTITGDLVFDGSQTISATDDLYIGSNAGIQIQTDNGGTQKQFQFGIDGNLTVPNYIVFPDNTEIGYNPSASPTSFMVSTANTLTLEANTYTWSFGADGTTIFPNGLIKTRTNQSIGILAIDGGSLSEYPAQLMAQQVAQAQPDTVISSYDNRATIQTDVNGTIKTWTFGRNGSLTFPNLSVQNTAFTGTAIDQVARNSANAAFNQANTTITISQLKSIAANAATYGDFQIAIAAL